MTGSLYLAPTDPHAAPSATQVLTTLRRLQVIGGSHGADAFLAGAQLLSFITFAGCSPQLSFEPPRQGGSDFCHVALLGPYPTPRMLVGPNTVNPRCPSCNRRIADWRPLQAAWQAAPGAATWTCAGCGARHPVERWRWRRHALFGRLLVAVHGVFPSEAVPDERLLAALSDATGVAWDYGWAAQAG